MVPVVGHCNVINMTSSDQNIMVLVPTTVDSAMADRIVADQNMVVTVIPVMVPLAASRELASAIPAGAGPATTPLDQSVVDRMIASPNLAAVPLMPPIAMDQTLFNAMATGRPIVVDQTMLGRLGPQPMVIPTMMGSASADPLAGRGPTTPSVTLSRTEMSRVLTGSQVVMVPMMIDRTTMRQMIAANNVSVVVPMIAPVPVSLGQ
jgi:hypothetical protein